MDHKKVMLLILDGWGYGKQDKSDAAYTANTPFFNSLINQYPNSKLEASGEAVGLPAGQMGNSEVGHMNLGAGRIVYQELGRINKAIAEGTIKQNHTLTDAFDFAKKNNKPVHFIGLVSDGGVHAHINHLKGLLDVASAKGLKDVFVHAFTEEHSEPKLMLSFSITTDQLLECKIEDNGIGVASNNKSKLHKSKGTQLARERLELLQPEVENGLTLSQTIEGTIVIILIRS